MQYIGGDLDLGSSWSCGSSYSNGSGCGGGGGGGGGGGSSGEAIREGEPIALTQVDVYLLNPVIGRAKGAASIGGCRGLIDQP